MLYTAKFSDALFVSLHLSWLPIIILSMELRNFEPRILVSDGIMKLSNLIHSDLGSV